MPLGENVEDDKSPTEQQIAVDGQENEDPQSKDGESASNSFENMESLLVEDDESDANEDPLGTESLLMSGSESDGEKISPVKTKKKPAKIVDSDDEEGKDEEKQKETATETGDKDEENQKENTTETGGKNVPNQNEIPNKDPEPTPLKPKKFSALIDSDSEPEEEEIENSVPQSHGRFSTLVDSDSEASEDKADDKVKEKKKTKKKASKKTKSKRSGSDSESEKEPSRKSQGKSKPSALIESESDSPAPSQDENDDLGPQGEDHGSANERAPKKKQRASAKKAIDEMQAIQSETQRLYRETHVSIPYHKPKRHTLKEFLTRRTIVKPQLDRGSGKRLKMTSEELEEYAKQLDERAHEAEEFFKSESEEELVDKDPEETNVTEEPATQDPSAAPALDSDETKTTSEEQAMETEEVDQQDIPTQLTAEELMEIEMEIDNTQTEAPPTEVKEPYQEPPGPSTKAGERPSSLTDLKRRLVAEKNLPANPTLQGGPAMMIDFETGDLVPPKPTGLESLFERFAKSNALHKKKPKEKSILSTDGDTIDLTKITGNVIDDPNKEKEPKPGAAYVKLKESLRSLIVKKRKQDFQKKLEGHIEEEEEYKKCCGIEDEEEEAKEDEAQSKETNVGDEMIVDEDEDEVEVDEGEPLEEPEEDEEIDENEKEEVAEVDIFEGEDEPEISLGQDAREESDVAEDEDDDDDSDEEEEEDEEQSTRKHRIIRAFEDSDEEKEKLDGGKQNNVRAFEDFDEEKDEQDGGLNTTSTSVLFPEEEKKNPEEVEKELLGLCSGQFEESQREPIISQIPTTQAREPGDDDELMGLCSGVFNAPAGTQAEQVEEEKPGGALKILSSDEENDDEKQEPTKDIKKVKKLKKKQKKRAKLGFSDDEDDEEEEDEEMEQDLQESANEEEEEPEEEIPETFIDYDSEENEVEVQMTKKDCVKQATKFLENEAELSESEWGSADEDEKNMDKYDIELGDEDEFDREKIQAELGQIHMRKVLDDDIREVKKIQEMLFDNEEADGVGRQRQFRWKNIENGFSLDDPADGGADKEVELDSADDEEEIQWRKMRFEREQFLKQKTKEEILAEVSETAIGKTLLATMGETQKPNYKIFNQVRVAKEYKKPSFLIEQNDTRALSGSFLNYDKEILAKLGEAALKSGLPDDETHLQKKAKKNGNFVFAPLSEEEKALRKRKAEEEKNAKNGNLPKKAKPNPKPLFLDKLL